VALTSEDYLEQLRALLPRGRLWASIGDKFIGLLWAAADEFARVDARAAAALLELDPRTAVETLDDWENIYSLPHTGSTAERQARLTSRVIAAGTARPEDFRQKLAPILGIAPDEVEVVEISRAKAIEMADDRAIYNFYILRSPLLPGTFDLAAAQTEADRMRHAHTRVRVIRTRSFRCDDPNSLCDRDLLGV
jgi:uncharacterized protein YmfQ (DUF2313 family)